MFAYLPAGLRARKFHFIVPPRPRPSTIFGLASALNLRTCSSLGCPRLKTYCLLFSGVWGMVL